MSSVCFNVSLAQNYLSKIQVCAIICPIILLTDAHKAPGKLGVEFCRIFTMASCILAVLTADCYLVRTPPSISSTPVTWVSGILGSASHT